MEETNEKTGVILRVAVAQGGIIFEDDPSTWFNATPTAKKDIKADLKGKKVKIRMADKPNKFSFISLSGDQPEISEETKEKEVKNTSPTDWKKQQESKDDYWIRKEARDLIIQEQIAKHGAINSALQAIATSVASGSTGVVLTPGKIIGLAETLANDHILPFVKGKDKIMQK